MSPAFSPNLGSSVSNSYRDGSRVVIASSLGATLDAVCGASGRSSNRRMAVPFLFHHGETLENHLDVRTLCVPVSAAS